MKALFLAAALALSSVPAVAATPTTRPAATQTVSPQQLNEEFNRVALLHAKTCASIYRGDVKLSEVVSNYKLNDAETADFIIHCKILDLGLRAGIEASQGGGQLPEASGR